MGETPFYLTYRTNAIIHVDLGEVSWRRRNFEEEYNSDNLRADLDLIHDIREEVRVRKEAAKSRATCWYNSRVKAETFHKEDLIWRKVDKARRCREEGNTQR